MTFYALFPTALGACALAWGPRGIVALRLPEANEEKTRGRLLARHPQAEETALAEAAAAAEGVAALLAGEKRDLSDVAIDLSALPAFDRAVLEATRAIPVGETRTYGEIARAVGDPGAARRVGQIEGRNPVPIIIPCHRVMGEGGKLTGFSAPGGVATKLKLLEVEGAFTGGLFGDLPPAIRPHET